MLLVDRRSSSVAAWRVMRYCLSRVSVDGDKSFTSFEKSEIAFFTIAVMYPGLYPVVSVTTSTNASTKSSLDDFSSTGFNSSSKREKDRGVINSSMSLIRRETILILGGGTVFDENGHLFPPTMVTDSESDSKEGSRPVRPGLETLDRGNVSYLQVIQTSDLGKLPISFGRDR